MSAPRTFSPPLVHSDGTRTRPCMSKEVSADTVTLPSAADPADVAQAGEGAIPLMRHREPWTAAEVYHLGRLHEAKRSAVSIAAVLQRSEHAVRMKAAELAMWFPRECKDYRGAYRAYEQGMSWPLILATFGLSKGDVHWWVKRFGGGLPWPPVSELEAK